MKIKTIFTVLFITLFFVSCKKKDEFSIETRMIINHYQQTAMSMMPTMVYLTQTGSYIGTDNWDYQYVGINGFNYESGYVYDLDVLIETIPGPPIADSFSSYTYTLKRVNAKTKVAEGISFEILLKLPYADFTTGNASTGFKLGYKIGIDCGNLCTELGQALATQNKTVTGTFIHKTDKSYLLTKLDVK